ncbi:TPA: hypothetical protein N0F65_007047 [Lagenidium giganteum]|uniref:26S proteasome regulatory subunit RPN3 n=1 Tax=Lagenidium giganteum TaxID=4803 RepID=A0AAV2YYV7_9STRA|nr:TPA: hypothetical protein N0F65_007047 [Lagenidium giganteum]
MLIAKPCDHCRWKGRDDEEATTQATSTMGTYLEDYLESIYMLPSEIKRNFDLMRELDKTSYPLIEELKTSHKRYLVDARKKVMERLSDQSQEEPSQEELRALIESDAALEELRSKHQRAVQKLDEKIAIAAQSYDIVDHHIQRLDRALEEYAALLKQSGEFEDDKTVKKKKIVQQVVVPVKKPVVEKSSSSRKRSATDALLDAAPAIAAATAAAAVPVVVTEDLPIDPNEPVYCHCRRVSFGQMVGCDNDDCKYEWFHFEGPEQGTRRSNRQTRRPPMSARSTFAHTPAYTTRFATKKEVAAEEALVYEELRRTLLLLENVVKLNAKEKIPRILRNTSKLRKTLSVPQLVKAVTQALPESNESRAHLVALFEKIGAQVNATVDTEMTDASEPAPEEPVAEKEAEPATPIPTLDLIEVEVYFYLYVLAALVKLKLDKDALATVERVLARCQQFNRRTLDPFQAKVFAYYASIHEQFGRDLPAIRHTLLSAHRTACLRYDEFGQATLLNLLLRNYLHEHLYDQAYKFVSKTTFPESVSNNQFVRYLYYVGKIQAVQLEYTESYTKLMQSIRKAPQNTASGFRRTVHKLAIIVQLLMGEVPERSVFNQDDLRTALMPYLQLTNAVRIGNLEEFNVVLNQHAQTFKDDNTYTLILRLRHNVIKTGLRKISTSYSRIRFADICTKLALETPQDAEFICAKAIRDGVIDAVIDHKNGWLQSKDTMNVYTTNDPQVAFQKRITFCLDVHNEAVKGMRYPPDAYKKDLESAEERLEREKQEEELAKEIEGEMDDEGM